MAKHEKTLKAIFAKPTLGTIEWRRVESLFLWLGAEIIESEGSRITVLLGQTIGYFHRPHPRKETSKGAKETSKGAVVSTRTFLTDAGHAPAEQANEE